MELKFTNKSAIYYIEKIIKDIKFVLDHVLKVGLERFCSDEVLNNAVSFKFIQISENVKKLPKSLMEQNVEIPWFKISGLRNKIVHDYGSIQLEIIYDTVANDLPDLLFKLESLLRITV